MDIDKQIDYWRTSALEDLDVAQALVKLGRYRHGLFLAHLSLEKMSRPTSAARRAKFLHGYTD